MATDYLRCEYCGHIALVEEFDSDCPECSQGDVFPYRKFRCLDCGTEDEQDEFFGEHLSSSSWISSGEDRLSSSSAPQYSSVVDPDPIEEGWEAKCPNCASIRCAQIL